MPEPLAELIASLRSDDPIVARDAAQRLSRMGSDARGAAVPLAEAAAAEAEEVCEWAAAALEELGPPLPEDLDRLIALLGDPRGNAAYWAATLLGRLEAEAAAAVPMLATAVTDHADAAVRQRAVWALSQIGPAAADALPALEQAAAGPDPRLARLAGRAIQSIGSL